MKELIYHWERIVLLSNVSSAQAAPTEANPSCQAPTVQEELLKMGFDSLVINEASKRLGTSF
jgi:hypothetical protein